MEKTKVSIAILRVIFVFCLFVFAASYLRLSFGWFSENKAASVNGAIVKVGSEKSIGITQSHVFRYTDNGVVCSSADSSQTYEMMKYDAILTDKNVNTPLFFRVAAEGIPSDGTLTVTVPLTGVKAAAKISSVVSVKVAFGLKIGDNVEKDTFTPHPDETENSDNVQIFNGVRDLTHTAAYENANYVAETFGDSQEITLTINSGQYADYMCAIENGVCDYDATEKNALVFYIVFDYEKDLISEFQSGGSADDDDITFSNDIGTITIG